MAKKKLDETSLDGMSKKLEKLKKDYQNLGAEQRNNDLINDALLKQIKELSIEYDKHSKVLDKAATEKYKNLSTQIDKTLSKNHDFYSALKSGADILERHGIQSEAAAVLAGKLKSVTKTISDIQGINNKLFADGSLIKEIYDIATKKNTVSQAGETQATTANTVAQKANAQATTASAVATTGASKAMRIFKVALASTGIGLIIIAVGELIANFDSIKKKLYELFPPLKKVGEFFDNVTSTVEALFKSMVRLINDPIRILGEVWDAFKKGGVSDALDIIKKGFRSVKQEIADTAKASKEAQEELAEEEEKINKGRITNHTKTAKEIKDIHYDANQALLDGEKDFQDALVELMEAEAEKRAEQLSKDKLELKKELADGLLTREEYALKAEELTYKYIEREIKIRQSNGLSTLELEEQLAEMRLTIREREEKETREAARLVEESEADSHKTRIAQWQEYAQKVSAISQQVSEITSMVTNSLGGMFSQLSASYAQEIESLNEKIAAVDEEKEAALERVALTEDQRRAREEELAQQKINLEYATSEEQKNKADERIATLQGELGAEDSINRDFESKKASLEKEKEKKEKAQKKAEKMQKRLEMGQAIVEAIGNIAQGAAKALSFGPILGPILAAVVSAAGAIQVGVMTKQLAKMEDGGLLNGKRHSQGGMRIQGSNIEVEGGEYVVNRQTTQKNLGLMNYINSQHKELSPTDINSYFSQPFSVPTFSSPFSAMMEQGGQVPMLPLPTNADTQQILQAIGDINFQPRVAITDIHHAEQQMARVDEWTGM